MSLPSLQLRHYRAEILTSQYLFSGDVEPLGPLLTYLNDASRRVIMLKGVEATALDADNALATFRANELLVGKNEVCAIGLPDPVSKTTVHLLPRREKLRVVAARFVIQALFHCGSETRVGDLFEATPGQWATASDAHIYPLLPCRAPVFETVNLLLLNKAHIRFYQSVTG